MAPQVAARVRVTSLASVVLRIFIFTAAAIDDVAAKDVAIDEVLLPTEHEAALDMEQEAAVELEEGTVAGDEEKGALLEKIVLLEARVAVLNDMTYSAECEAQVAVLHKKIGKLQEQLQAKDATIVILKQKYDKATALLNRQAAQLRALRQAASAGAAGEADADDAAVPPRVAGCSSSTKRSVPGRSAWALSPGRSRPAPLSPHN